MQILKDRIVSEGACVGTEIVKVDSFLNHRIDVSLLGDIGMEFARRFQGEKIDKILTIESSGIAVACMTADHLGNLPVVFAKKTVPNTMTSGYYKSEVRSFTKGTVSEVIVSEKYLESGENVLIIDDFLAHGEAACGLASLVEQAGGSVVAVGAVIGKFFQGGEEKLRQQGYRVEVLANIKKIDDGKIFFCDADALPK